MSLTDCILGQRNSSGNSGGPSNNLNGRQNFHLKAAKEAYRNFMIANIETDDGEAEKNFLDDKTKELLADPSYIELVGEERKIALKVGS